jgi:hypothetical protein
VVMLLVLLLTAPTERAESQRPPPSN